MSDDLNEVDSGYKVSKINSGLLINLRLDYLWKECHKHSRIARYSDWNGDLDCVWCELGGEYEEDSDEYKEFNKLNQELGEFGVTNWTTNIGFKKIDEDKKILMTNQYNRLMKKELFLRRLQNKQGKGTAYHSSDEDYMD